MAKKKVGLGVAKRTAKNLLQERKKKNSGSKTRRGNPQKGRGKTGKEGSALPQKGKVRSSTAEGESGQLKTHKPPIFGEKKKHAGGTIGEKKTGKIQGRNKEKRKKTHLKERLADRDNYVGLTPEEEKGVPLV